MKKENEELDNLEEKENSENSEVNEEISETDKLSMELGEMKDKYLRLYSEFDNFRKRTAKERIDTILNATEGLIKELILVVDDFERAKLANEKSEDAVAIKEGIDLIHSKLFKILQNKGLKAMESTVGKPFNVEQEEVVAQFPSGEENKGKVVDELEKGYYLNDKVIRYAKVVVGN